MVKYLHIGILLTVIKSEFVSLIQLSPVEGNVIITTEATIRNILTKIVQIFNLEFETEPIMKEYYEIHNKLLAPSLQSGSSWAELIKLAEVNVSGAMIDIVTEVVNEVTNYTENPNKPVYEDQLIKLIDAFLTDVERMNFIYGEDIAVQAYLQNQLMLAQTHSDEMYTDVDDDSEIDNDSNEFWSPTDSHTLHRRVFEGKTTTVKRFPFVAAIFMFGQFHCAGAVVSSDLVVTAASGVQLAYNNRFFRENPSFVEVRVGSSFHALGGELIPVINIYFYPSYNPVTLKDNICLLRLIRHIRFKKKNKRVKKIEFDKNEAPLPNNIPEILILGWGSRSLANKARLEGSVAYARLSIYSLADCQAIYSKQYVTSKNFCAGFISKGGGACNQDLGDPGVFNNVLFGIVSFAAPLCGSSEAPTVFTKIGYYSDWMESIIEESVPVKKSKTSTTPYIIFIAPNTTTTQKHRVTATRFVMPMIVRQPENYKEILRDQETEYLNESQKLHLHHSKTKHRKKHAKKHKKVPTDITVEPYSYEEKYSDLTTKKPHRHHSHYKHKKTKDAQKDPGYKPKKSKKTQHSKQPLKQNKQNKIHVTNPFEDFDAETTKHSKYTVSQHLRITHKKRHRLQKSEDVPLISKYKLRDLLQPNKPLGLEAMKKHNIHKNATNKQKKDETAKHNNKISKPDQGKQRNTNVVNLQAKKQLNSHNSLNILNKRPLDSTIKSENVYSKGVTPFDSKLTKHSSTHNKPDDSNYDYYETGKTHHLKNLQVKDKLLPSDYDAFSPLYGKVMESADLYDNYDNIRSKDRDKLSSSKKLDYTYDSLEEKNSDEEPDKIYNNKGSDEKYKHIQLILSNKRTVGANKVLKELDDYYNDDFEPEQRRSTLSNLSYYSDYDNYKDYQDAEPKTHGPPKSVKGEKAYRGRTFRPELSKFEELDSHEVKSILKHVVNQPEGSKLELLQELFETHKKMGLDRDNSSMDDPLIDPETYNSGNGFTKT